MTSISIRPSPRRRAAAALLTMVVAALMLVAPAARPASAGILPATIIVTTTTINDDPNDGKCSLYEALSASFQSIAYHECSAGSDTTIITFGGAAASGTITFPADPHGIELPMINKNVSIIGPITLDGNGAHTDQHIFRIAPDGTLNLTAMVLRNAHTSGGGGAILDLNHGTLNIAGVSFTNNVAEGDGGAINSNGTVHILTSNFVGNRAQGIMPDKSINPSTGYGGAIHMDGSDGLTLAASNFSGNLANKGGGALHFSADKADISDVAFSGNIVDGTGSDDKAPQGGGAILNSGSANMTIIRTAFSGNLTPTSSGGALFNQISATAAISSTSFNGNIAASPSSSANGGAIYNQGGHVNILRDTFLNNAVVLGDGGAIANDRHGITIVSNTSFTANAALKGNGGAINNTTTQQGGPISTVVVKNATFSANAALTPGAHGGAIFNAAGHDVSIGNSILDTSVGDNCTGTLTSLGHNLENANTCGFNQAGDLPNVNPKLDTPGFNGGPIVSLLTQKLLAGSPALDAGDPAMCAAAPVDNTDQRGDTRPKGAACDIGSFEDDAFVAGYGSTPVQPGPLAFGATVAGTPIDTTFSIFETGNATLHVSNPQFSGANASDFVVKPASPFPLDIPDGGAAATITLTCTPAAAGPRSATLTLDTNDPAHAQVAYSLNCDGTAVPQPSFASTPPAPGPINFGDVTVNTGVNSPLTLKNVGDAALTISSPQLGGANPADFTVVTAFPITIAAGGAAVPAQVQCKPTTIGIRTATLTLATNDPAKPAVSFNLACHGKPVPPPILDTPGQSTTSAGLDGAYGVAISPDGQNVYATGYNGKAVTAFQRNAVTGALTSIQTFTNVVLNSLNGARLIAISPDGKNIYIASQIGGGNPGSGALVTLNRDPATGMLSPRQEILSSGEAGLAGAYGVVISPDGRFVYVSGNNSSGTLVVFSRDMNTGIVSKIVTITDADLIGAHGLALSPDGVSLYVTAYASGDAQTGKLVTYKRNAADGTLSHIQTKTECDSIICLFGIGFLDGLGGAYQVTVSPDGQYVYAVGTYDGAVVVFKRSGLDGSLTRVRTYKDNTAGVDGLDGVSGVAASPDGAYLYATGYNDKGIAVFKRDAATGLLNFAQLVQRSPLTGAGGVPALDGARDIRVSPDGASVYAAAFVDDAVVALHTANPIPALTSLSPASAASGSAGFKLTVNGASFVPGAVILIGPSAHTTTFVNNTQLTTTVAASEISAAGQVDVTVANPTPGGGASNAVTFTITAPNENAVPSIDTLGPASASAGNAGFTLTINGSGFITSSAVQWNGASRPTSFVSSTKLTAQISVADIAQPGPAGVVVVNPGPGGGASNAATFDIAAPGQNPTPSITTLSPGQIMADAASARDLTLVVTGENFIPTSRTQWNGSDRPTTFVSATQLKLTVTAADLAAGGQGSVTVHNPAPGGGDSNTATFMIFTIRLRLYLGQVRR